MFYILLVDAMVYYAMLDALQKVVLTATLIVVLTY